MCVQTMEPMLVREIDHANSMAKIDILNNQISDVRTIMEVWSLFTVTVLS